MPRTDWEQLILPLADKAQEKPLNFSPVPRMVTMYASRLGEVSGYPLIINVFVHQYAHVYTTDLILAQCCYW